MSPQSGPSGTRPSRRLEAHQSAFAGRDADRTAPVTAVADRHHARRHRCGRTTARPARRVGRVPWVAGGPVGEGLGRGQDAELGGVGAPHHHESRRAQAAGELLVVRRHIARRLERTHALVDLFTRGRAEQVLQDHGHTAKRPVGEHTGGFPTGLVEAGADDRVELGVELLDPVDGVVDELRRRRRSVPNQVGECGGVEEGLGHGANLVVARPQRRGCCAGTRRGGPALPPMGGDETHIAAPRVWSWRRHVMTTGVPP